MRLDKRHKHSGRSSTERVCAFCPGCRRLIVEGLPYRASEGMTFVCGCGTRFMVDMDTVRRVTENVKSGLYTVVNEEA